MRFLPKLFARFIQKGRLTLIGPDGETHHFGRPAGAPELAEEPEVLIRLKDPSLDWRIPLNAELRFSEAYMDGDLDIEQGDVKDFITLFYLNKHQFDMTPNQIFLNGVMRWAKRFQQNNSLLKSRRNAQAHYDIGNDLYRLFLDEDMQYSCGYFPTGTETLEEAQVLKKRHIAAKLLLKPGQRVLDIGCGWGGMALTLAKAADVSVVGVTLAEEQLKIARARAEAAGLSDRVEFRLMDYREVEGKFDRIVSVGMLEHVGAPKLMEYFLTVRDRLAPRGIALIHSIITKAPPGITSPFIRKYIFPGGYSPSVSEIFAAVEKSGLFPLDGEFWRRHYAMTLAHWLTRFTARRAEAKAMYDERFCRMWELYLAAAEAVFVYGPNAVLQLQLGRENDAAPISRDYIAEETARLAAREATRSEADAAG